MEIIKRPATAWRMSNALAIVNKLTMVGRVTSEMILVFPRSCSAPWEKTETYVPAVRSKPSRPARPAVVTYWRFYAI